MVRLLKQKMTKIFIDTSHTFFPDSRILTPRSSRRESHGKDPNLICLRLKSKAKFSFFFWIADNHQQPIAFPSLSRLIFSHQKVNICIITSFYCSNLCVWPGGFPRFVAVDGSLLTIVIFCLSLIDGNNNNIGWLIKVHYLTMAGGFNPRGHCRQVRAKIRLGGFSPWDFPIGFVDD